MIGSVCRYVISVISASFICAAVKGLLGKSSSYRIVHMLCGIFLVFTFLAPLKHIDLQDITKRDDYISGAADAAVSRGEALSQKAMTDIISAQIASYVEEKASALGVQIRAVVLLENGEIPSPAGMVIEGQVSPYIRKQLEVFITETIGLDREDIRWDS